MYIPIIPALMRLRQEDHELHSYLSELHSGTLNKTRTRDISSVVEYVSTYQVLGLNLRRRIQD